MPHNIVISYFKTFNSQKVTFTSYKQGGFLGKIIIW